MFGEQICRILLTFYLTEVHTPCSDGLLYPQRVGVQVPQLAQALACAYTDRRTRVGPHTQGHHHAEVFEQSLVTEALPGASDYSGELCFARAQMSAG